MIAICRFFFSLPLDVIGKPLRKHAYSNILKILPPKNEKKKIKK